MARLGEIAAGAAVELLLVTLAVALLYRVWGWFFAVPKRQIVQAFQSGVILRDGKVEKLLGPGRIGLLPNADCCSAMLGGRRSKCLRRSY
jgi:hypothetical protein